jgi:hypothetical protein
MLMLGWIIRQARLERRVSSLDEGDLENAHMSLWMLKFVSETEGTANQRKLTHRWADQDDKVNG